MAQAQSPATPTPFRLLIPISKIDEDKRLVRGVATAEVLDAQGEIVDYDSAKAAFGAWKGNIREMHQLKAVGKKTDISFDDAAKQIVVESYISKGAPDTWEKVKDGTLSMYSLGGTASARTPEKVGDAQAARLFLAAVHELSLVDNGACPDARFEMVKTVDGNPTDVQPDEADPEKRTIPAEERDAADDKDFAGFDRSFPILKPEDVKAAARSLGRAKGDRDQVKAKIVAIAYRKGADFVAELPEKWKKAEDQKVLDPDATKQDTGVYPEPWDIESALHAIAVLEQLLANEVFSANCDAERGEDVTEEVAQIAILRQALGLVLEFLFSEYEEQFAPAADPTEDLAVAAAQRAHILKFATAKVGARNSKTDMATIQGLHDSAVKLGAACATEQEKALKSGEAGHSAAGTSPAAPPNPGTSPASPASVPVVVKIADLPEVQAVLKASSDALKESQATIAAQAGSIAELTTRIKALEDQPLPGGPVTRAVAVEKTLAGAGTEPPSADDQVLKAFDLLATVAKTDAERLAIAQQKLVFMQRG